MMRASLRCMLLVPLLLGGSGCSQWYYNLGEPLTAAQLPDATQSLDVGAVLAVLGPPQRFSALPAGYAMAWEQWRIRESAIGFSLGFVGADLLTVDVGDARVRGKFLLATFDSSHQLLSAELLQWDNRAGSGQSLQPLGGIISVVSVDDLLQRMPQHDWGFTVVQPLPRALNVQSRPGQGSGGLEQRGTPRGVGQRTLEW